ncbi:GreA/GreB family elongation factor [Flavobacterium sp.]|uniref:GreA/GreB family elongation factor n=1 Tax=Flavobacterium sp. TaxID=239 RepID=UPI0026092C6A|nr:GreA/GreB family elongation factor [Flavobacterium sp.]MDD3003848.1 GreA/GreB family elongation factor [Flavobacterium sp.]
MTQEIEQQIVLTTGIYDLIKDHIRRKKTSKEEEEVLLKQLKKAKQVTRKNLPLDVVTVDAKVIVKDIATAKEAVHTFVAPDRAKRRNNTESILSPMGLALVGCKVGDVVTWTINDELKQMEIIQVERLD